MGLLAATQPMQRAHLLTGATFILSVVSSLNILSGSVTMILLFIIFSSLVEIAFPLRMKFPVMFDLLIQTPLWKSLTTGNRSALSLPMVILFIPHLDFGFWIKLYFFFQPKGALYSYSGIVCGHLESMKSIFLVFRPSITAVIIMPP